MAAFRKFQRIILFVSVLLYVAACSRQAPVALLSVSSDGNYIISTHVDKTAVLWDIRNKKKKVISKTANVYSAYFIRNTNMFAWQDEDNVITLATADGAIVKSVASEPVYGHLFTSDLKTHIASNLDLAILLEDDKDKVFLKNGRDRDFYGAGKLLNLSMSNSEKLLVASGFAQDREVDSMFSLEKEKERNNFQYVLGVSLWDVEAKTIIAKLPANAAKTHATISPDGNYVVAGSENGMMYVWSTHPVKKIHTAARLRSGIVINPEDHYTKWKRDKTGLIPPPPGFRSGNEAVLAVKFISDRQYLRFSTYTPYAILYDVEDPLPKKYFFLGDDPMPSVHEYVRNASIDTAPDVGILVTGQHTGGGINVYKFDKENLTLERIWVAD